MNKENFLKKLADSNLISGVANITISVNNMLGVDSKALVWLNKSLKQVSELPDSYFSIAQQGEVPDFVIDVKEVDIIDENHEHLLIQHGDVNIINFRYKEIDSMNSKIQNSLMLKKLLKSLSKELLACSMLKFLKSNLALTSSTPIVYDFNYLPSSNLNTQDLYEAAIVRIDESLSSIQGRKIIRREETSRPVQILFSLGVDEENVIVTIDSTSKRNTISSVTERELIGMLFPLFAQLRPFNNENLTELFQSKRGFLIESKLNEYFGNKSQRLITSFSSKELLPIAMAIEESATDDNTQTPTSLVPASESPFNTILKELLETNDMIDLVNKYVSMKRHKEYMVENAFGNNLDDVSVPIKLIFDRTDDMSKLGISVFDTFKSQATDFFTKSDKYKAVEEGEVFTISLKEYTGDSINVEALEFDVDSKFTEYPGDIFPIVKDLHGREDVLFNSVSNLLGGIGEVTNAGGFLGVCYPELKLFQKADESEKVVEKEPEVVPAS